MRNYSGICVLMADGGEGINDGAFKAFEKIEVWRRDQFFIAYAYKDFSNVKADSFCDQMER